PGQLQRLLDLARQWFPLAPGGEFSVEANPVDLLEKGTGVFFGKPPLFQAWGVTRISLGVQSFDARKLGLLERDHGPREIGRAYEAAQSAADSISLDLIFGVPGESLAVWRCDLEQALALRPD